ncbi:MAG: GMP/IMP nucleotidase [Nevskia sp.]|nr:GMP/IMP nucleotidase [Nevskia sp.]
MAPQNTASAAIDWEQIDHVLVDMDGTVLDLAFDNHFWRELVPRHYGALHALAPEQAWERLLPHFRDLQGKLEWYCMDHWSELTGLNLAALTLQSRERIAPLPGSDAFLRAVRASGRGLWLVTNAHRDSWQPKLAHTGYGVHFDHILCSHDFGAPKEDPRFWPALRQRHFFDPRRAIFIDDSLPVLRAARDFGFAHVIAIRHPDTSQPVRVVDDFEAVDRLADLLPIT